MEFARRHKEYIINAYVNDKKSTYQIADELKTYSNKIRSALKFLGIPLRSYKEAQALVLETGRSEHPTKGKKLSENHKNSIGKYRAKVWREMTDEDRAKISNMKKEQWDRMSDSEKSEMRRLAAEAVRMASKDGSKSEKFVRKGLAELGYDVLFHVKDLVPNHNFEIDFFIPELKTVIEIDGPSHFLPIWGEEKLIKTQKSDAHKTGLVIENNYAILRVRQLRKTLSKIQLQELLDAIVSELEKIRKKFPPQTKRLIEIEVNDGQIKRV